MGVVLTRRCRGHSRISSLFLFLRCSIIAFLDGENDRKTNKSTGIYGKRSPIQRQPVHAKYAFRDELPFDGAPAGAARSVLFLAKLTLQQFKRESYE